MERQPALRDAVENRLQLDGPQADAAQHIDALRRELADLHRRYDVA